MRRCLEYIKTILCYIFFVIQYEFGIRNIEKERLDL